MPRLIVCDEACNVVGWGYRLLGGADRDTPHLKIDDQCPLTDIVGWRRLRAPASRIRSNAGALFLLPRRPVSQSASALRHHNTTASTERPNPAGKPAHVAGRVGKHRGGRHEWSQGTYARHRYA